MKHIAPAIFIGWQPCPNPLRDPIPLYILTRAIDSHPAQSTVSDRTLRDAGYEPPKPLWRYRG